MKKIFAFNESEFIIYSHFNKLTIKFNNEEFLNSQKGLECYVNFLEANKTKDSDLAVAALTLGSKQKEKKAKKNKKDNFKLKIKKDNNEFRTIVVDNLNIDEVLTHWNTYL